MTLTWWLWWVKIVVPITLNSLKAILKFYFPVAAVLNKIPQATCVRFRCRMKPQLIVWLVLWGWLRHRPLTEIYSARHSVTYVVTCNTNCLKILHYLQQGWCYLVSRRKGVPICFRAHNLSSIHFACVWNTVDQSKFFQGHTHDIPSSVNSGPESGVLISSNFWPNTNLSNLSNFVSNFD